MYEPKTYNYNNIIYIHLLEDQFLLAVSPSNYIIHHAKKISNYEYSCLNLSFYKDKDFILLNKEQQIRHISNSILDTVNFKPKVKLTVRNFETTKRLAHKNTSITFIPFQYSNISKSNFDPIYFHINNKYEASWNLCIAYM